MSSCKSGPADGTGSRQSVIVFPPHQTKVKVEVQQMSVNRRRFLGGTVAAAVACVAGPLYGLSGRSLPNGDGTIHRPVGQPGQGTLLSLDRGVFAPVVGSVFAVGPISGGGAALLLTLLSVGDLPAIAFDNVGLMAVPPKHPITTTGTTGFVLSFLGPSSQLLGQDTYRFEHDVLGMFDLFVVPSGAGQYTAVVNQLAITQASSGPKQVPVTAVQTTSTVVRPAQEPVEPLLRNFLKSKRVE